MHIKSISETDLRGDTRGGERGRKRMNDLVLQWKPHLKRIDVQERSVEIVLRN